jgi:hypothetical protein
VLSERNWLQAAGSEEVAMYFHPYLFDLTNLEEGMCRDDMEFVYPPRVHPLFNNIKDGLYLLDNGLCLYLFISKKCNDELLNEIFGGVKGIKKLSEESLMES